MKFRLLKPKLCPLCNEAYPDHAKCGDCTVLLHESNKDELNWWYCKTCAETRRDTRKGLFISLSQLETWTKKQK